MATDLPLPLLLTLLSAALSFAFKLALPRVFLETPLTILFVVLTTANLSLWSFWCVFIYPRWLSPLRYLPKPKGARPILGFGGVEFQQPKGEAFLKFINDVPNEGLISVPGFFNSDQLFLTDPAALSEVLVHKSYHFQKPGPLRKFLRIILGNGLVVVEDDEHKFQRKHVSPAFSFRHIKDLYPIFWAKSVELAGCVAQEAEENAGVVEVNHWANQVTMDIIGVAGLGRNFNTLKTSDDPLIQTYEEITQPTTEKVIFFVCNILFPSWFISMLPWKLNGRLKATTAALRNTCHQLLLEKKDLIKNKGDDHFDILSTLIKSNDFSNDMLVDQLLTFLAAGHETTASAFTWATYLLAKHPEVQACLRTEIRAHLSSSSSDADVTDILDSLPLLHGVCNETLRLYPTVPSTIRIAVQDTTITSYPVAKGTKIFVVPWAINRSTLHWGPDAAEFKPERWITDGRSNNTGGVTSNYSMLTFLHGPRSCIGEKFAKAELKALMAVWCGSFEMEMARPGEVAEPAGVITVKPMNGMNLRLKKVDGW